MRSSSLRPLIGENAATGRLPGEYLAFRPDAFIEKDKAGSIDQIKQAAGKS